MTDIKRNQHDDAGPLGTQGTSGRTPRRNIRYLQTTAEIAIQDAIDEVEKGGADIRLTEAVTLLDKAKNLVADCVDEFFTGNGKD